MPIVENNVNRLYFNDLPILSNFLFLLDDLMIEVDGKYNFWGDNVSENHQDQVNYELFCLRTLLDNIPVFKQNSDLYSMKQTIDKFQASISSFTTVSIENICYNSDIDDFLFHIPVRLKFLPSLFIHCCTQNYFNVNFPDLSDDIIKAKSVLSKKQDEFKDCNDADFVNKKTTPLVKKLNHLKQEQINQKIQKEIIQKNIDKFIATHDLTETYDWITSNVTNSNIFE